MTSKRKGRVTKKTVWEALNAPIRKPGIWCTKPWPMGEVTIIMAARGTGKTEFYRNYYNRVITNSEGSAQKYFVDFNTSK